MNKILHLLLLLALLISTGCSQKKVNQPKTYKTYKTYKKFMPTKYTNRAWHRATMRKYKVLGKTYYPHTVKTGRVFYGISSWYGPKFNGKKTSNGEIYNMYAKTAAHKTLPMDTIVKVTNLTNRKSTIVRINDRGPFVKGRIIDCSYRAGKDIGLDKVGIARVSVKILGFAKKNRSYRSNKSFEIQLASYRNYRNANLYRKKMQKRYRKKIIVKRPQGNKLYRVCITGFNSRAEAITFRRQKRLNYSIIIKK